jgi:hypothetical protein
MLANEKTPLGRLAELLTVLDRDGLETLPEQVLREISNFEAAPWSVNEEDNPLPDPEQVVRESVLMLIDQLLEQSPKGA